MASFDINKVQGNDRFIAGGAVALIVLSFLPWYAFSGAGHSSSVSMWHAYGWNKLAWFLAVAAGAIVIARLMGALDSVNLPAGVNLITLALSGLATLIFLLRLVTSFKSESIFGVTLSAHPSIGWYLGLLVSAAMTYFAFLNFQSSGEQLPSQLSGGGGPSATPPSYPPPPMNPPAPPTAPIPMTPQTNVAPPTEFIPQPPPPPPAGQDPGYPKTGP